MASFRIKKLYFFIAFACMGVGLQAQANASLDSTHLETGNPMTMHLSVPGAVPTSVDFSAWDSLIPHDNIISATNWQQTNGLWTQDIIFTAFDSVRLELPPLTIQQKDGSKSKTNPLSLLVTPTPIYNADGTEIKGIHHEPGTWWDYWWVYALILLFCGIAFFVYWVLNQQKNNKVGERYVKPPAHLLALRKLETLQEKQLWQQGQLKEYYSELTFIGREYLEKRYGIPALESTSDEIAQQLQQTKFAESLYPLLRDVLQWADLAKFAKAAPPADFHEQAMGRMRMLIESTAVK